MFGLGFGIYLAQFSNFAANDLQIRPDQLGLLESIREIPGLLTVPLAALVMPFAEPAVGFGALLILGVGWLNYVHLDSVAGLIVFSLIGSVGFHMWMPVASTIALRLAPVDAQGRQLGTLSSIQAIAQLAGIGLVVALAGVLGLRALFAVAGGFILTGAGLMVGLRGLKKAGGGLPRMLFRRQYRLYYGITLLDGARRHIFLTFAIFLLVKEHAVPVQTIALLSFANGVITIGAAYAFGRWIDRFGERRVLTIANIALAAVFVGYATIPIVGVLFALYVLDSMFFSAQIGTTTYLQKILVDPAELRPSLTAGQTMNHVAAVIVPVIGGVLWETYGAFVPFVGGAVLASLSAVLTARIRVAPQRAAAGASLEPAPAKAT